MSTPSAPSSAPAAPSRGGRLRLGRTEWIVLGAMAAFIVLLHVVGWGLLIGVVAPQNLSVGSAGVFGIGIGVTAYTLGMRHAFDADHIAAIDNTTRKLMSDGQKPVSVGFWFSLGHSSVVFGLCFLLGLGVKALASQVTDGGSQLQTILGLVGTAVSGTFLILIGLINLVILRKIVAVFRRMRGGDFDEAELEHHLSHRGFMNRLLGGVTKAVRKPRHMYPVGLLFGLGFDTATEVSLLVLAGGASAFDLPWYAVLILPVLFAAGMSLLDTIDGTFMNFAYGWAFSQPVRKVYYNIVITGLSIAVALVIGVIEIVSILADKAGIESGPIRAIADIDLNNVGFVIVGLFVVTWIAAIVYWKVGKVEQRWSVGGREAEPEPAVHAHLDDDPDGVHAHLAPTGVEVHQHPDHVLDHVVVGDVDVVAPVTARPLEG